MLPLSLSALSVPARASSVRGIRRPSIRLWLSDRPSFLDRNLLPAQSPRHHTPKLSTQRLTPSTSTMAIYTSASTTQNGSTAASADFEAGLAAARTHVVPNVVLSKVQQGQLAHSLSIKLVRTIEIVHYAAAGFDAVLIDLEHSSMGLETTSQLSCAALQVG